jgi:murein DD-endopeptidase MepM/ murein hydrolase activator NlpD
MFPSGGAGTPVRPAVAGTLSRSSGSSTNTVYVNHGNGWRTMYAHMTNLRANGSVARDTTIGRVGAVGTGAAHLHYEQQYYHDGAWRLAYPHFNGKTYRLSEGDNAWSVNRVSHSCLRPKPTWWCEYRVTTRHYKRSWAGTKYESEGSVQPVGALVWAGVNELSSSGTWRRARNSGGADKRGNWVIKEHLARTSKECHCDFGPCPS